MRRKWRVAGAARRDVREVVQWTIANFRRAAAVRYRALIEQAINDVAAKPQHISSRIVPGRGGELRTYHLFWNRDRVSGPRVQQPRHILLYRIEPNGIEILRILHEARDLDFHLLGPPA